LFRKQLDHSPHPYNKKNNMLAKSNGLTLQDHSNIIETLSVLLTDEIVNNNNNFKEDYKGVISVSCKLHDIGKLTKDFQNFLSGGGG
jgi:CRISPR/Cas system-associated endonuclease Cas3-HD